MSQASELQSSVVADERLFPVTRHIICGTGEPPPVVSHLHRLSLCPPTVTALTLWLTCVA